MTTTTTTEVEIIVTLVYSNFSITTAITVPADCVDEDFDWSGIGRDGETLERIITDIAGGSAEDLAFLKSDLQDVVVEPRIAF